MMRTAWTTLLLSLLLAGFGSNADAALTMYAALKIDGTAVNGDTSQTEFCGQNVGTNHIEIYSFDQQTTSSAVGSRTHGAITIRKRVDRSSVSFYQALIRGSGIEGVFKFFDNATEAGGDGLGRMFETWTIGRGSRITSIRRVSPNVFDGPASAHPLYEEITISFTNITYRNQLTGEQLSDSGGATR